ncbi:MAG: hypothetical protein GY909_06295 [Oligoflexia bacterium]|nr:hypothetical protein [Oligoflexia bacterium]
MKHLVVAFSILLSFTINAEDMITFDVDKLFVQNSSADLPQGSLIARSLQVVTGKDLVSVSPDQGPFRSQLILSDKKLLLKGETFSLATDWDFFPKGGFSFTLSDSEFVKKPKLFQLEGGQAVAQVGTLYASLISPSLKCNFIESTGIGCGDGSHVIFDSLYAKTESSEFTVKNGRINFLKRLIKINSDDITFTIDDKTIVQSPHIECAVDTENEINEQAIIQGCIDHAFGTFKRIDSAKKSLFLDDQKGFVDVDDLKEVEFSMKKGEYALTGKVKVLFSVSFKVKGRADFNSEWINLHVDKAKIAGIIPARKFLIHFLKKFISSDAVIVQDNTIQVRI